MRLMRFAGGLLIVVGGIGLIKPGAFGPAVGVTGALILGGIGLACFYLAGRP